ncbi:MAG TPA: hypothetical protein VIQ05_20060 [Tardiphaga sp.]
MQNAKSASCGSAECERALLPGAPCDLLHVVIAHVIGVGDDASKTFQRDGCQVIDPASITPETPMSS